MTSEDLKQRTKLDHLILTGLAFFGTAATAQHVAEYINERRVDNPNCYSHDITLNKALASITRLVWAKYLTRHHIASETKPKPGYIATTRYPQERLQAYHDAINKHGRYNVLLDEYRRHRDNTLDIAQHEQAMLQHLSYSLMMDENGKYVSIADSLKGIENA